MAEPPAKRVRLDVSEELAKGREQRDREIALRERELVFMGTQRKLDMQKFDACEEKRWQFLNSGSIKRKFTWVPTQYVKLNILICSVCVRAGVWAGVRCVRVCVCVRACARACVCV